MQKSPERRVAQECLVQHIEGCGFPRMPASLLAQQLLPDDAGIPPNRLYGIAQHHFAGLVGRAYPAVECEPLLWIAVLPPLAQGDEHAELVVGMIV
jgi:hypothetical protein